MPFRIQHDVSGFEIPKDDLPLVKCYLSSVDLDDILGDLFLANNFLLEIASRAVLQYKVQFVFCLKGSVNLHDERVVH